MKGNLEKENEQKDKDDVLLRIVGHYDCSADIACMSRELASWYGNHWGKIAFFIDDVLKHDGIKYELILKGIEKRILDVELLLKLHERNDKIGKTFSFDLKTLENKLELEKENLLKQEVKMQEGDVNEDNLDKYEMNLKIQKRKEKDKVNTMDTLIKRCEDILLTIPNFDHKVKIIELDQLNEEWLCLNKLDDNKEIYDVSKINSNAAIIRSFRNCFIEYKFIDTPTVRTDVIAIGNTSDSGSKYDDFNLSDLISTVDVTIDGKLNNTFDSSERYNTMKNQILMSGNTVCSGNNCNESLVIMIGTDKEMGVVTGAVTKSSLKINVQGLYDGNVSYDNG